jgi:hypothetical protein
MRLSKIVGYGTFLLLAVAVLFGVFQLNHNASAVFGRNMYQGYFDGQMYTKNNENFVYMDGLPTNWATTTTTAQIWTDNVHAYLYNDPATITPDEIAEQVSPRMAATILMMMGVNGTDPRLDANPALPRWQNGVNLAKQLYPAWLSIVMQYDAGTIPGARVDWNATVTSTTAEINGSGLELCPTIPGCDVDLTRGAPRQEFPDVAFVQADDETKGAVVFYHPNGTVFTIKKWCGNMIGDEQPFPMDWTHTPTIVGSTPTGNVTAGTVLNFQGAASNTGSNTSSGGVLTGNLFVDGALQAPPLSQATFPALAPAASTSQLAFTYTVPAFAAAGTQYCFATGATPHSYLDPAVIMSSKLCYTIGYSRAPSIQGMSGDVHAGGGICNQASTGGNITGKAGGASLGEYVVATSGFASNFGSNSTPNSSALTLGQSGGYSRACRPDLLQAATNGRLATSAVIPSVGGVGTADLTTLTGANKPEVYYFDGADLYLSGTITTKVTIVATVGKIHIGGNITIYAGAVYPSRYVPSLGLIAQGDILIDPIATRVDAYMFSNGSIDTCSAHDSTCTTPQLVVNGFLMGKDLLFNRLGTLNSSGVQVTEKIVLTPQLYLNPPMFFNADTTKDILQAQGEKPPLF